MIRFSKLNDAQYCGLSASLETNSTNIHAMMGDAFHGGNAAHYRPGEERFAEDRAVAFGVIGKENQATVTRLLELLWASWTPPDDARFEVPIALTRNGTAAPYGTDKVISQGTADCVWVEGEFVVVVDFKSGARAEWNVPIPRENLQLLGYGIAFADLVGKTKVRLGIYLAHEEKWLWDEIDLDTEAGTAAWERVRGAALHDPTEAVMGPHCFECWTRLQCPAFILSAISEVERDSALAPLAEPLDGPIEPGRLLRLLNAVKAMEGLAEAGKEFAKVYVDRHGPLVVDGKQWGPSPVKPKESTSIAKLKDAGLYDRAVAVGAVTTGEPGKQFRWTNAKGAA